MRRSNFTTGPLIEPQPGVDRVGRQASVQAFKNKDFRRAEEIAQGRGRQPR